MPFSFYKKIFVFAIALVLTTGAFLYTETYTAYASTGVPPTILTYQGRLTDASGNLLGGTGTNYYLKFSIWDSPTVGSGNRLWPTNGPATTTVNVAQGVFTVNIGDTANGYPDPLNLNFANNSTLYLQVEVSSNNITSETLSPRQQLTSAVFAQVAGAVVGTTTGSLFGTTTPIGSSFVTVQATSSTSIPLTVAGTAGQSANIFQVLNNGLQNLFSINSAGVATFANAPIFSSLTSGLHAAGVTGATYSAATSTVSFSGPFGGFATLGALVGGSNSTINWTGLATTSQPSSSNLLVSNGGAGVYGVATSTLTASSPLTGSFTVLGSTGSLGCQTASGSQAGCLASSDWTAFNSKDSFAWPFSLGTNSGVATSTLMQLNGGASTTVLSATGSAYFATSAGSVGIGTTTPANAAGQASAFAVTGYANFNNLRLNGADTGNTITQTSGNLGISTTGGTITLGTSNGASNLFIGTTGLVGIGTTSPSYKLSVEGSSTLGNQALAGFFTATSSTASLFAGGFLSTASSTINGLLTAAAVLSLNGGQSITGGGLIQSSNTSGYQFGSGAPSASVPTLIPNRSTTNAGIGADTAGDVSIITNNGGGTTEMFRATGTNSVFLNGNVGFGSAATSPQAQVESRNDGSAMEDLINVRNNNGTPNGTLGSRIGFGVYRNVDPTALGASIDAINTSGTVNGNVSQGATLLFNTTAEGSSGLQARMTILNTGNVGIGSTTPLALLSVGTNNIGNFKISTSTSGCAQFSPLGELYSTGSNCGTGGGGASLSVQNIWSALQIFGANASTTQLSATSAFFGGTATSTFTSAGFLGVGTTTPWGQLSINPTSALGSSPAFVIGSSTATDLIVNNAGQVGIGNDPSPDFETEITGTSGNGYFGVSSLPTTNGDILTLNPTGFLGLGTSTPQWNLEVAGTRPSFALSDSSAGANLKHWLFTSEGGNLYVGTSTDSFATSTPPALTLMNNGSVGIGSSSPDSRFSVQGVNSLNQIFDVSTQAGAVAMHITAVGNVGIGTTTPNWQFQIAGTRPTFALSDSSAGANLKHWLFSSQGGNLYVGTSTDAFGTSSPAALSISNFGTTTLAGLAVSASATSTSNVGFNLTAGCFAISGTCLSTGGGSGASLTAANTWTQLQKFNGQASSTQFSATNAYFGGTATSTFTSAGFLGIGTSTPYAALSINSVAGQIPFAIGSTTSPIFNIDSVGNVNLSNNATITGPGSVTYGSNGTTWITSGGNIILSSNVTSGDLTANGNNDEIVFHAGNTSNTVLREVADDAGVLSVLYGDSSAGGAFSIGTTSPNKNWTLNAAGAHATFAMTDNGAGKNLKHWLFTSEGGSLFIGTSTDAYATSTTPSFALMNNGRVGIGTSTPTPGFGLSVQGGAYFAGTVSYTSSSFIYGSQSTTTIPTVGIGAWTIASSTSVASNPIMSINSNAGTTTISFFGATTTGLTGGIGLGVNAGYKNGVIIGNGKVQSNVTIANGSLCVSGVGWCTASSTPTLAGSITARNFNIIASEDVAEMYASTNSLQAGDIVSTASSTNSVVLASATSTGALMGAVSTDPAITLGLNDDNSGRYPIALTGQVPVFVNLENGPIYPGDRIAVSSVAGVGRKANASDPTIGISLGTYTQGMSSTTVLVFIQPQQGNTAASLGQSLGISQGAAVAYTDLATALGEFTQNAFTSVQQMTKLAVGEVVAQTAVVGNFFSQHVFTQQIDIGTPAAPAGITLYDTATHAPYCLTITNGSPVAAPGVCGTASSTPSTGTSTPSTPPTLTLVGANPAQLHVGDTFVDPGATAQDAAGHGLDVRTYLNGTAMSPIQINTSATSTYEIEYSATDGNGNSATTTRSVVVQ